MLLLLSLLLPLGLPVRGAPQHLICDSRVLERYILEAKEAENVTVRPPLGHSTELTLRGPGVSSEIQEAGFLPTWHLVQGWRWEARAPSKNDKTGSL